MYTFDTLIALIRVAGLVRQENNVLFKLHCELTNSIIN